MTKNMVACTQNFISLIIVLFSIQIDTTAGHGFMTKPAARNINDYDKQSLAAGGPATVNAGNGYRHGMCGNSAQQSVQNWNTAAEPQYSYTAGEEIAIDITITAHHLGFFEFDLCDSPNITENCFRSHRLVRSNCDEDQYGVDKCRRWWKPALTSETGSASLGASGYPHGSPVINGCGATSFTAYYRLPEDVTCTHCVLRWHWYTTNSCTGGSTSEEFWNCADVRIDSSSDTIETKDTSLNSDELIELNQYLTSLVPQDLSSELTEADNWRCLSVPRGEAHEYSCAKPGESKDDTSACQSDCGVEFFGGNAGSGDGNWDSPTAPANSYCSFNGICQASGVGVSAWCDGGESQCLQCSGIWCRSEEDGGNNVISTDYNIGSTLISTTKSVATQSSSSSTTRQSTKKHTTNPPTTTTTKTSKLPETTTVTTDNLVTTKTAEVPNDPEITVTKTTTFFSTTVNEGDSPVISYCSFQKTCEANGIGVSEWCDASEGNCVDSCHGLWCQGTNDQPVYPEESYCSFSKCKAEGKFGDLGWCDLNEDRCSSCDGTWCPSHDDENASIDGDLRKLRGKSRK